MSLTPVVDWGFYQAAYWSAFYGFTFGCSLRSIGREHVPVSGPVLLVSNHQSFIDPVLVGVSATRQLTYLARDNLFHNRILGRIIRHYGAVPIDRGFGKEGLMAVLRELDRGSAVLMFPEGERSQTGALQPLKPGVSLLLKRVTCPIVPVGISGAYAAWPRQQKWPSFDPLLLPTTGRAIAVAFGPPLDPSQFRGRDREAMLAPLQTSIATAHAHAERIRRKVV
ncbi:lysophospholipid acyltransferase family protein [Fimbriiglobus ruber]|uniref:1-acyl-sn-glycerol-3-phosphate acyltransferase n=1 Tax=Fimbriiglobus ruber TaxID=1908690 RepID=A0A225DZZ2_9BACT|nr:lysophospholipid acyltransferase family protein [Fimbriiglobus ruber]OWK43326.1 1-acyl-sn-glycerol-3-phosphate acyltransferase [Fimbriiglobus ruber]